jgi:S-adenosylmethionine/arginine decarboxylase-like enzyme
VFTCGQRIDPKEAAYLIGKKLDCKRMYEINLERGQGEIKAVKGFGKESKTA